METWEEMKARRFSEAAELHAERDDVRQSVQFVLGQMRAAEADYATQVRRTTDVYGASMTGWPASSYKDVEDLRLRFTTLALRYCRELDYLDELEAKLGK